MDLSDTTLRNALAFKPVVERAFEIDASDAQCVDHLVTLGIEYLVCRLVDPQRPKASVATILALVDRDPQAMAAFFVDVLEGDGPLVTAGPDAVNGYV